MRKAIGVVAAVVLAAGLIGCSTIHDIVVPVKRVEIKSQISMPLFYVNTKGKVDGTWDYLAKSPEERARCRAAIKETCKNGETPAIAFLLSAQDGNTSFARGMWNNATFPNVNEDGLKDVTSLIKELCSEGIAVFPTLYSDGGGPNWTKIGQANVQAGWAKVNESIGQYVAGYAVSIEQNEDAQSLDMIQNAVAAMRTAMPGAPLYGTHMQFHQRSNPPGTYCWMGSANRTTPNNVDFILLEFPWQPGRGDAEGMEGVKRDYQAIRAREPKLKLIWHEFNLNPAGNTMKQQREWMKQQKYDGGKLEWGVGHDKEVYIPIA